MLPKKFLVTTGDPIPSETIPKEAVSSAFARVDLSGSGLCPGPSASHLEILVFCPSLHQRTLLQHKLKFFIVLSFEMFGHVHYHFDRRAAPSSRPSSGVVGASAIRCMLFGRILSSAQQGRGQRTKPRVRNKESKLQTGRAARLFTWVQKGLRHVTLSHVSSSKCPQKTSARVTLPLRGFRESL